MDREPVGRQADELGEIVEIPERNSRRRSFSLDDAAAWLNRTTNDVRVVDLVRRVRRALPGDPEFGDPLSTAGEGGPQAAARAADRLMGDRSA
ncbi:MAG TPA: adenylate/guanylate cyclase domain-containing protein, partial [Mycobacterium sp.]|nr:adenylate/guanylate cyclase domain-containing protein [Mycobacterium sp.]